MNCCDCCKGQEAEEKESEVEITLPPAKSVKTMPVASIANICQESQNVLFIALNIMKNYLGQPCYPFLTRPRQLYPYIRYLCGEENLSSNSGLLENKEKEVFVTVVIKEGNIVHPKYSAFSRVYCKISVSNGRTEYTSIKENDSNLSWDEVFSFAVPSYANDTITIEVWSAHPLKVEEVLSYADDEKSATSQLSRNSAAHYRIGSIRENIRDLPCVGRELLWTLRKGPRRLNTRGQLSIFTQLSTKKAPDHKLHIIMQMEMLKLCYEKQLPVLEPDKQWKNWLEILPNAALTLLQQHALQYGLTSTEQCVCSWIVASALKINQEGRISFYFLHTLLEGLISDIYEDPIEPYLEGALGSAIIKFSEYNKSVLGNLHNYFEVQIVEEADELFYLLKSMCSVEMQTYSNFLDSYVVIAGESYAWYLFIFAQYQEDLKEHDVSVEKMCEILMKIIKIFLKNQIILDDIFTRAWTISYSKITFTELDSVINDTIKPMIQHLMLVMRDPDRKRVIKESLQLLQLYHNVRNLVQYVLNDLPTERAVLSMDEYSSWFGDDLILEWFLLCDMFTKPYIKRAVIADSMERLTKDIPHSTSVPDIVSIIDEMVIDVWTKLKWEEQFYTHAALLEAVRTCVLDYVQALYDRMCLEDLLVAAQDLGINEKLCVSMSNLYAVFEHLYTTKNKIKGILRVAESNYGFTIMDPMASIGTQMQIEISAVYLVILEEESTILFYYVIGEACTYIEKILEMLYLNLKAEAFYIVLRHIWIIVITCVKRGLESYQGCYGLFRRKTAFVAALQTLTQLQEIFYCDGHGLSHQELRNPIFEELKHKIEVKLKIQDKTIHQKEYLCV